MKLIKAKYEILTPINGEQIIFDMEKAARTCYKSEGKIEIEEHQTYPKNFTAISGRKLVQKLIKRGHDAMLEFGQDITVKFTVDRGVSHELVRHRMASFAQESTRYVNYKEGVEFIIPCWLDIEEMEYDRMNDFDMWNEEFTSKLLWLGHMLDAEEAYKLLITDFKWSPQQARSILPNSLKTEINVKANLREWRHIFKLRTAKAAHPQMREVMCPLLEKLKKKIPIIFDDITY